MATFLPRPESTSDRLAKGLRSAASEGIPAIAGHIQQNRDRKQQQQQEMQENEALQQLTGEDYSGLSPEFKKIAFQNFVKKQEAAEKLKGNSQEKMQAAATGLETIKRQRERLKTGLLGTNLWSSRLSGEGRKVRAGYVQAGKSLIQLASTLPIRNQQEFEALAEDLYDPNLTEETIEGILDEMEALISNSIGLEAPSKSSKKGTAFSDARSAGREWEIKTGSFSKVQEGTKLPKDMAIAMVKKYGRAEAEKKAKELGYAVEY